MRKTTEKEKGKVVISNSEKKEERKEKIEELESIIGFLSWPDFD